MNNNSLPSTIINLAFVTSSAPLNSTFSRTSFGMNEASLIGATILIFTPAFVFFNVDFKTSIFLIIPFSVVIIETDFSAFVIMVFRWSYTFFRPLITPESSVGSILSIPCLYNNSIS